MRTPLSLTSRERKCNIFITFFFSSAAPGAPAGAPTGAQKQINYQQLEENINKWMQELENQEKEFLEQATHVNAWDRLLVENGEKVCI